MPADPCLTLVQEPDGRLSVFVDDEGFVLSAYRRWGQDVLAAEWHGLTFSRPSPNR